MKRKIAIACVILAANATPLAAHRLDEYLQATTIMLTRDHLRLDMRLAPGVAIVKTVLDSIDTNRDGALDTAEQREYGLKVIRELTLTVDYVRTPMQLVSWQYGTLDDLKRGTGEILLRIEADAPGIASRRTITLDNRHRSAISSYLVNSLVPEDNDIHIVSQNRNYLQSTYELAYEQTSADSASISFGALGQWALIFSGVAFLCVDQFRRRKKIKSI